ncbi:hypothetical protein [Pseudomonas veronii]
MKDEPKNQATMIDDAYMEQFTNDQLAFMAWDKSDFAMSVYLDSEESKCPDCTSDARFELMTAVLASKVLIRRLTGINPQSIRDMAVSKLLGGDCFPQWETLQ